MTTGKWIALGVIGILAMLAVKTPRHRAAGWLEPGLILLCLAVAAAVVVFA